MYTVYILQCRDGSLYTGITTDLDRRLEQHLRGKASKYTRAKLPVSCVYSERQPSESVAKKREWEIKGWSRSLKLNLVRSRRKKPSRHG